MAKVIFDSSALLTLIKQETGHEVIQKLLLQSSMSIINVAEVITVLTREGLPQEITKSMLHQLIPEIILLDMERALVTGFMISDTINFGLSLGDRACIATAVSLDREIYTTDKAWTKINIDTVKIHLIR